ncbi:TIGR01906 family membrane protein [Streptococcus ovuberis]|uniref:TIGR01906 family membrane protein n=1 Tax=Streptococcus ovuberis TaxID=1936207 RepID=A0A7X6MZU7_9STRE|nr:TIGR01906 family membrane protein [Streptococcus ovuberis]NKZ20901.1 TIGR01906 family membrane protein [Streptococcus ovuberis]
MKIRVSFFAGLVFLLGLSILLTIYVAWLIYPLEIQWLGLTELVSLSAQTIVKNFSILMTYLTNPFNWTLRMPDFASSADGLYHFEAVKKLFHLAQGVTLVALVISIPFLKVIKKNCSGRAFAKGFLVMALAPIFLAIFASGIGFSRFFVLFHQVLFPGDTTWLFHPDLDPVIKILPETYFLHCFILFFIIYEGLFLFTYLKLKTFR